MANVLQARFTALYVQTGTKSEALDKEKLEEHIRYAERLGAEIVMTHGENIPVQIAEYARLSNVTKIVIGQSNARRNHFFSKSALTEKLIEIVPDIDIHIIPDAVKTSSYQKRSIYMVCRKTVCKRLFFDRLYICSMHFHWSVVSETEFHRYEYCNDIHSGSVGYFNCDR